MWWGGFSEIALAVLAVSASVLIPMWWGGFSEHLLLLHRQHSTCLNPHVVGRFFRERFVKDFDKIINVLIPMWWGGFSERRYISGNIFPMSLNPHVVGRFFRERRDVFSIKFSRLKWSISKLQIFTKINGD